MVEALHAVPLGEEGALERLAEIVDRRARHLAAECLEPFRRGPGRESGVQHLGQAVAVGVAGRLVAERGSRVSSARPIFAHSSSQKRWVWHIRKIQPSLVR